MLNDVVLEASYGTFNVSSNLTVYPRVVKKAQEFVLYFDYQIEDNYTVELVDSNGNHIETIYNSQLSIFNAKSSISLEIFTPLIPGMYYVVLSSKDFSQATKLMKF